MSSPPSTLGQYQIIREIARSNDIVYEAYDPLMNRRVALKELAMPNGSTPQQREDRISRFKREAQAAGTLAHPNIMTVFSFAEEGGRHFMALEFLDGHTLRNEIDSKGFLPPERAVEVALEVLNGLEHAHSKGVVHRDIKPDNIQILSDGGVKITDFGIARLTFQPNLTMDGQVFGTPSYMSPEQVVGKDIDARSDLFSVGVMLYEMLSGQKPFAGDSVVTITYAIMNKEPAMLHQIGHALWAVVARAMEKSPTMRYASAAEMAQALRDAQRAPTPSVNPYAPTTPGYPTQALPGPYAGGGYASPSPYGQNPYTQPYATPATYPAAPPVPNPQAGVYTTPYGGAHAPTPPPVAPPVVYPYNPYGQPGMGAAAPHTPSLPTPGPAPVYYPPPPRQPLLKPETRLFLGRLVLAVLVLGTFLLLVVVAVNEVTKAYQRSTAERQDAQLASEVVQNTKAPLRDRIAQLERLLERQTSERERGRTMRNLAALYEELGRQHQSRGDLVHAEEIYRRAVDLDNHNATLYTNLAALYATQAQSSNDRSQSADLWRQAAEAWSHAAEGETNPDKRAKYKEATATSLYRFALDTKETGDFERLQEAREELRNAKGLAPAGSDLAYRIDELLSLLEQG